VLYCTTTHKESSVSDPDSLIPDPDPAFKAENGFGSGSNLDPDPKLKKI
jgi:hypothetical protein